MKLIFKMEVLIMGCCEAQRDNCCGTSCGCEEQNYAIEKKKIIIDFMYLDLSICTRCQDTGDSLGEAIEDVAKVLELAGAEVVVNKIHIDSKEKAIQYRFESSPTIRINGKDIQLEIKESLCESCGDLCGDEVDCRVWVYDGKEYNVPPKAMIIDAILREVYSINELPGDSRQSKETEYEIPEFWDRCRKDGTVQKLCAYMNPKGVFGDAIVGICFGVNATDKDFPYAIGAAYEDGDIAGDLTIEEIPSLTWAIFKCTGAMPNAIQEQWHRIYSEFFPTSEYQPCGGIDFEVYPEGDIHSPNYESEIWISVAKK
jgi:predicted transcriptional regulator YdeE